MGIGVYQTPNIALEKENNIEKKIGDDIYSWFYINYFYAIYKSL